MRKVNVNNCKKYSSVQSRQRVERSRPKLGRSESEYVEDESEDVDIEIETDEGASRSGATVLSLEDFPEPGVPPPTSAASNQDKPTLSVSATTNGSSRPTTAATPSMPPSSISPARSVSPNTAPTQPAATTGDMWDLPSRSDLETVSYMNITINIDTHILEQESVL